MITPLTHCLVLLNALHRLVPDDSVLKNFICVIYDKLEDAIKECKDKDKKLAKHYQDLAVAFSDDRCERILYLEEELEDRECEIVGLRDDLYSRNSTETFAAEIQFAYPVGGSTEISLIKALREHTSLSVERAKALIESCEELYAAQPAGILLSAEKAQALADSLNEADPGIGATVHLSKTFRTTY
jgi:ribosomal protein L7/L12